MMYSDIIVLTKHFPFGNSVTPGETYLENEISILALQAENVFVFACDATADMIVLENLPKNVHAYALCNSSVKVIKAAAAISGLRLFFSSPEEVKCEAKGKSIRQKLFLYYFTARASIRRKAIEKMIGRDHISFGQDVLIYSYWFYDFARAGLLLKNEIGEHVSNVRCFSRAHGYDLYAYRNKINYLPLRPWLLENLDWVFPCSKNGRDYLHTLYPAYARKVIEMYIGTHDFGGQEVANANKVFHVVSCSQVIPIKRVERILETIVALIEKGCSIDWTHIGGGPGWDTLSAKVSKHKAITGNKIFLSGSMKNHDVLSYYSSHYFDVFLNASTNEGLPTSIMEAASFGIPVIATEVGGTSEIVQEGVNGYLLPEDFSDEQLEEEIMEMMRMQAAEYAQLRHNARKVWEENFQADSNAIKMLKQTRMDA